MVFERNLDVVEGSNRHFQDLDLYRRSPESGNVGYASRQSKDTICWCGRLVEGDWVGRGALVFSFRVSVFQLWVAGFGFQVSGFRA